MHPDAAFVEAQARGLAYAGKRVRVSLGWADYTLYVQIARCPARR
jgi:hypothetical protein